MCYGVQHGEHVTLGDGCINFCKSMCVQNRIDGSDACRKKSCLVSDVTHWTALKKFEILFLVKVPTTSGNIRFQ